MNQTNGMLRQDLQLYFLLDLDNKFALLIYKHQNHLFLSELSNHLPAKEKSMFSFYSQASHPKEPPSLQPYPKKPTLY